MLFGVVLLVTLRRCGPAARGTCSSWLKDLPDYKSQKAFEVAQATKIYSADGKLLARSTSRTARSSRSSQIVAHLANGIVAIEDERFYEHKGVDPIGLVARGVKNRRGQTGRARRRSRSSTSATRILLDERTR